MLTYLKSLCAQSSMLSCMIAYNADSGSMMGVLYHYPPTSGKGGEERRVFEWDTGVSCYAFIIAIARFETESLPCTKLLVFIKILYTSLTRSFPSICILEVPRDYSGGQRNLQCCGQHQ